MAPEVVAAVITGSLSLLLALYNFWLGRQQERRVVALEERRSELAREEALTKAKLDYEYEARRRLYERFEPLLFQLLELAEYALEQIKNLTDPAVWKHLVPGEPDPPPEMGRPPMVSSTYEITSTLYGLFAPLVVVRSMSRALTLVDLSLEKRMECNIISPAVFTVLLRTISGSLASLR